MRMTRSAFGVCVKEFIDGLKQGFGRFEQEWFKVTDEAGQDGFLRFGMVTIAVIFVWPLLSFFADVAVRWFQ
jgi:hypothetical protein